jgi:nucleotide-binding universal stress UspA family protein
MVAAQSRLLHVDAERRARAETELDALVQTLPPSLKPEALVAYGEPAEEIAKIANDRDAGLIVMGLHSSPLTGPRMGSVTYRVLCLAPRLVLAIPPVPVSSGTVRADVECAIVPHARVAPS